jgi:hypothetical protein
MQGSQGSACGTLSADDCRAEHDRSTRVFQTSDFDLFRDLKGVVDLNAARVAQT